MPLKSDPVSALNIAVMGHFKPHANLGEKMPLEFGYRQTNEGFVATVHVCGKEFEGSPCTSSKAARKAAACEAVQKLITMS